MITSSPGKMDAKLVGLVLPYLEFANQENFKNPVKIFGIPDNFVEHGTISETHTMAGIDFDAIFSYIKST